MSENILQEADRITSGDRALDYGHVQHDFTRIAMLWTVILDHKILPEQVPLCMLALKLSREIHKHKRDNLVDIAGYARTIEMLYGERNEVALVPGLWKEPVEL